MKQIAERLNVNESRVSQLHSAALSRLKTQVQALLHSPLPALGLESQAS
jgi:DNA-directed RNA polymerase sigma subunit (sigma70/sigma32)